MNKFDRFCYKYDRFGIKNLIPIVAAGQALMGIICLVIGFSSAESMGRLIENMVFLPSAFLAGQYWRIITFLFVPVTMNLLFIALSVLYYFFLGRSLEAEWGRMKLTIYYLSGVLCTLLFSLITNTLATTTYLNLSLIFALATLMPDMQIRIYFLIPIKLKYIALIQAAIFIVIPLFQMPVSLANLYPLVSILNYLIFFWKPLLGMVRHQKRQGQTNRRAVDFKSEVRRAKEERGYIHKCEVCSRTDTDRPDMEFRYCSLCAGYACYCADHIFNHTHKTVQ